MGTGFPAGMYTFLPDWRDMLFKYKFDDDRNNKFRRFIASPFVNDEVNALAEEALNKSSIGMDDITDLLALTYYAGNYAHKSVQECAMEIQDTYVRLDRSIANLLDVLDKKVGLQNVLLFRHLDRLYGQRIARFGIIQNPRRRVLSQPLRRLAEYVPHGYIR